MIDWNYLTIAFLGFVSGWAIATMYQKHMFSKGE